MRKLKFGEDGATAVEYAVLLALIAVVCIGAVGFFGQKVGGAMSDAGAKLSGVTTTTAPGATTTTTRPSTTTTTRPSTTTTTSRSGSGSSCQNGNNGSSGNNNCGNGNNNGNGNG